MKSIFNFKTLILIFAIAGLGATKAEPTTCKATLFPYARKQNNKDFKQLFDRLPRQNIVEYYFYELSAPASHKDPEHIGTLLGKYLIQTEEDRTLRSLYKAFAWASKQEKNNDLRNPLPIDEICTSFSKAQAVQGAR